MNGHLAIVDDVGAVKAALTPFRRDLLIRLREPGSAATLGEALKLPRQKIGYHLRVLEKAGLIAAAGTRQRRGFTEKLYETCGDALIVDPMILAPPDYDRADKQDRFAAEHLVRTAAGMVHDVSRMQGDAAREGSRLLTFTIEADVAFAHPSDIDRFTARLSDALSEIAADFAPSGTGRRYRVTIAGHPAVGTRTPPPIN